MNLFAAADDDDGDHEMQPLADTEECARNVRRPRPPCPCSLLVVAAAFGVLVVAAIVWGSALPRCTTSPADAAQPAETTSLQLVRDSIEMQVQPPLPAAWPSLKKGRKFYERALAAAAAEEGSRMGFEFEAGFHKERFVVRKIWQAAICASTSGCSVLVRYRRVTAGSKSGSIDLTLKHTRQFRAVAAMLPDCANATGSSAKLEANYYWKGSASSDVCIKWQYSCKLLLQHASPSSPPFSPPPPAPVIHSVHDVLPFFPSAAQAFQPHAIDTALPELEDCYYEREYKVSGSARCGAQA